MEKPTRIEDVDMSKEAVFQRALTYWGTPPYGKRWDEYRFEIWKRDDYRCYYCKSQNKPLELDHMIPVSRGGTSEPHNVTTCCATCNRQKKDKTPEEFEVYKQKKLHITHSE